MLFVSSNGERLPFTRLPYFNKLRSSSFAITYRKTVFQDKSTTREKLRGATNGAILSGNMGLFTSPPPIEIQLKSCLVGKVSLPSDWRCSVVSMLYVVDGNPIPSGLDWKGI